MRGNVGAEVEALLGALGRGLALLAPAFPANGRTTVDGVQLVGGVAAHLTAVGRDPAHPMRWPSIAAALAAQSRLPIHSAGLEVVRGAVGPLAERLADLPRQPAIVVLDAQTEDDLRAIAGAVAELGDRCLPVGSAGLAAYLPGAWGLAGAAPAPRAAGVPASERPLFVCGSMNPVTLEQVGRLPEAAIDAADPEALDAAVARLRAGRLTVLSSAGWPVGASAEQVASALGALVAAVVGPARPDALLLTGGDTARAVLGALGGHGVDLDDELLPGMPVGRVAGGEQAGVRVITKAGGFGPPDALVRAIRYLRGQATPDEEATR
jgi:uncharacterized protein YgbK (DUF1537 family)